MEHYFILESLDVFSKFAKEDKFINAHYGPLEGGGWLIKIGDFMGDVTEEEFKSHPDVEPLSHVLSAKKMQLNHASKLKEFGVTTADSTFDALEKIGKKWPYFRYKGI